MKNSKKVNLVRIISDLPVGGVERRLVSILPRLQENFNISVVCIREKGELADELEKRGIPVYLVPFKGRIHPQSLFSLSQLLKKMKAQIVHTHMYRPNVSGTLSAKIAKIPVIISNVHNVSQWDTRRQIIMDRFVNRFRDCVIAVSNEVKRDFMEKTGIKEDKCCVIYNGVDTEVFTPADRSKEFLEEFGIGEDEKIIVNSARLMPQKDHKTFLYAAKEVIKNFAGKVRFCIVGRGKCREEIKRLAYNLGIDDKVIMTGKRDDMAKIFQSSHISVLSSLKEGFSNVVLESMSCGIPVVATDVGGNKEAIVDGETGFLVKVEDYIDMANKIIMLLENESLRREFGKKARKRVLENFSIEKMIEKTEDLYSKLLDGKLRKVRQ
ncbi:MAG: glycosyltransferase [Candidatus Schekmanbacteria bacterium]|nr:MAG: glycosyltransferase [Candidatus Schekmanbacteria bacterium]